MSCCKTHRMMRSQRMQTAKRVLSHANNNYIDVGKIFLLDISTEVSVTAVEQPVRINVYIHMNHTRQTELLVEVREEKRG